MLKIDIPGFKVIEAGHLVLDFNGTLAVDGRFTKGVPGQLIQLSRFLEIHIVTADTFGTVKAETGKLPVNLKILDALKQDEQKRDFVRSLNPARVIAVGNGRNDQLMLRESALGIGIIQAEGACSQIIHEADIICSNPKDALDLLLNTKRLIATLRT